MRPECLATGDYLFLDPDKAIKKIDRSQLLDRFA